MRLGFIEEKANLQKQISDLKESDFAYLLVAKHDKDDDTCQLIGLGVNTFSWQAVGLLKSHLHELLDDYEAGE